MGKSSKRKGGASDAGARGGGEPADADLQPKAKKMPRGTTCKCDLCKAMAQDSPLPCLLQEKVGAPQGHGSQVAVVWPIALAVFALCP